jgi:putative ABC transport system permease protein
MFTRFFSELKMVIRGMVARKGRSFLTILGIVIGVSGVIVILSLGAGAQSLVLSQITKLGSNLIAVVPGKSNENGPPAAVFGITVTTLSTQDVEGLRDVKRFPNIEAVTPSVIGSATVVWHNLNIDTNFEGVDADNFRMQNIELASGNFFDESDRLNNVVVLGHDVKEQLFSEIDPIGQVIKVKNIPLTVVGVLKQRGSVFFSNEDDKVFVPFLIAQRQMLGINYIQQINIKVDDASKIPVTISDIEQMLRENHGIRDASDDDFSVLNLADAVKLLTSITDALRLFLAIMAGIALLVGGIGIMNIMLVTVAERTREIGLRKAVGATNRIVRNQFLLEASFLTFLGGIVGIIFGSLVSYLIAIGARFAGFEWAFVVSPTSVILAVGVSILTGIVFGLYPAFKAAKLDPITALRYE